MYACTDHLYNTTTENDKHKGQSKDIIYQHPATATEKHSHNLKEQKTLQINNPKKNPYSVCYVNSVLSHGVIATYGTSFSDHCIR